MHAASVPPSRIGVVSSGWCRPSGSSRTKSSTSVTIHCWMLKKGLAIILVAALLMIPLTWLNGLVKERTMMREQAVAAVARGWGGRQVVSGPVLAIPVTWQSADGKDQSSTWYVLADTLQLDVEMVVQQERRKLGVYE